MAQGDYWRIAVGVPLINPEFRLPTVRGHVLNGAHSAGIGGIGFLAISDPCTMPQLAQAGDYVTIGPSTHSDNPGYYEVGLIKAVASTSITLEESTTYAYSSGDPFQVIGTKFPGGWSVSDTGAISNNDIVQGYRDQQAFFADINADSSSEWQIKIGDASSGQSPLSDLMTSTYYRLGWMYKGTFDGTPSVSMRVRNLDGSGGWGLNIGASMSTQASWTEGSTTGQSSAVGVQPNSLEVLVQIAAGSPSNPVVDDFYLDNLVLSHAKRTSTESSAYVEFPEYPDFGSISYGQERAVRKLDVGPFQRLMYAKGFGTEEKWTISAQFSNLDQTFLDDLRILLSYQQRGNPLVLWTYLDDLPHAVYGYLDSQIMKDSWDWTSARMTFRFMEM